MTTPTETRLRIQDPDDLVAAVPHLIGFHPQDSLVVLGLHGSPPNQFGLSLRVDIPSSQEWSACARYIVGMLVQQRMTAAVLFVIGGEDATDEADADGAGTVASGGMPPGTDLVENVTETLTHGGIRVVHAVWAADTAAESPWRCYFDLDCAGTVRDPQSSALAAAHAAAGQVTFASRSELQRVLEPDPPEELSRRIVSLEAALDESEHDEAPADGEQTRHNLMAVWEAVDTCARGRELSEDDIVRLGLALSDQRIRDMSLATLHGEKAPAAEQLWLRLTRALPAPEVAEPATLFAVAAYLRGDGTLAGMALERAERARPGHRLAELLRRALRGGLPPSRLRTLIEDAVADARACLDEGDAG